MNFFKRLFTRKKVLVDELEAVKEALRECNGKLVERQEHINQTNAYWKKKMHTIRAQKKDL